MAIPIVMPRLGWTAEEAVLKEWLVQAGDAVAVGDALFSVEGDKAVEEIEALDAGILHIPPESPSPGQSAPVGTLLAFILAPGETPPTPDTPAVAFTADRVPIPAPSLTPSGSAASPRGSRIAISPRARKLAQSLNLDWTQLEGSGRSGRIVEKDVRAAHAARHRVSISPVAQRLARERGIDDATLAQAFPGQRISVNMVRRLETMPKAPSAVPGSRILPFSPTRQTIADRLTANRMQSVPVTLTTEMDASELMNLRQQLQADSREQVPSYNDLFMKILAHALAEHPVMNAHVMANGIRQFDEINIALAVHTEHGLVTPVVRAVDTKRLEDIRGESQALVEQARAHALSATDLQDGTFTLTNLGAWHVDAFTPVLNPPQIGILGLGRIQAKPMVVDETRQEIAIRQALMLSLTFDHRAVDGAPAADFLQRIRQFAECPYLWLTL